MTTTAIFGPFLRVSKATLVMFNLDQSPKKETKSKIIKFVFLLIALAPIAVLSYFFFTINWAWVYIFTFLSMQGIFSIVVLYNKNRKQFFEKYTKKLMLLTKDPETLHQNKIKQSQLFMGIFMAYFFFCVGCSGVENVIEYGNYMANLTNSTNATNVTGQFRQSIFENLDLFFINLLVTYWSTFISGITLAFMILSYKPIVEIYTKFNNDLKKSFEEQEFDVISHQKTLSFFLF
uniref:Uncharacterized protein n=1 Tax=Acrobeloides nanus TaxID=290746 RepID=A0A914DCH7_9BILA